MASVIYTLVVFVGLFQGAFFHDLLECYSPITLAYDLLEPEGGANEELPPIIFLHGAFMMKEYWDDLPQNVAEATKRKVYNLDARNHGDTEWTDCFNYDINALDVLHFMDEKSIEKAIIIGHSMGGITAIKVALQAPERVEKVFIEDIYTKLVPLEILENVVIYLEMIERAVGDIPTDLDLEGANKHVNDYIDGQEETKKNLGDQTRSSGKFKRILPLKQAEDGHYILQTNMKVLLHTLRSVESMMSENSGLYEGPAYFIYGTASAFHVKEEEEDIRKYFPNAELIGVEGSNHEVRMNFPDEYEEIVLNLLKDE